MTILPSTPSLSDAVLFCCARNAIRSPMAEGLMKSLCGDRMYVESAGVRGADWPDGFMVEVMGEIGLDMAGHYPQSFEEIGDSCFDLIIALSPEAKHHAMEMTRTMACDVEFWPVLDPSVIEGGREVRLQAFRQVRDQLSAKIKQRFRACRQLGCGTGLSGNGSWLGGRT